MSRIAVRKLAGGRDFLRGCAEHIVHAESARLPDLSSVWVGLPSCAALPDWSKALVTAAGFEAFALDFALACKTIDEVKARIAVAGEVKALCALAKANADTFIRDGKSLDEVRAALIDSRASGSEATHVSTTPRNPASPAPTQPSAVKATTADIWAKRRNPN